MRGKRHEPRIRTSDSNRRLLDLWPDICGAGGFEMDGGTVLVLVESDVAIAGVSRLQRALYSDGLDLFWLKHEEEESTSGKGMRRTATTSQGFYSSSCFWITCSDISRDKA